MQYQNRQPHEGINVTRHSPFLLFLKLMAMAVVFVVLVVFVMNLFGAAIAKRIPFRLETALTDRIEFPFGENEPEALVTYLNDLSARLKPFLPVPDGMQFRIHYNSEKVFNAYATLGGNLVFYRDLLREMPNENALAMVMAHEMAHVIHRDPLAGMSSGIASVTALMMLTGSVGGGFGGDMLNAGSLTQLSFSRNMESAADQAALEALAAYYGHLGSADTLFQILDSPTSKQNDNKLSDWFAEFRSTHPQDYDRILAVTKFASEHGWPVTGELTPLPQAYQRWLR